MTFYNNFNYWWHVYIMTVSNLITLASVYTVIRHSLQEQERNAGIYYCIKCYSFLNHRVQCWRPCLLVCCVRQCRRKLNSCCKALFGCLLLVTYYRYNMIRWLRLQDAIDSKTRYFNKYCTEKNMRLRIEEIWYWRNLCHTSSVIQQYTLSFASPGLVISVCFIFTIAASNMIRMLCVSSTCACCQPSEGHCGERQSLY